MDMHLAFYELVTVTFCFIQSLITSNFETLLDTEAPFTTQISSKPELIMARVSCGNKQHTLTPYRKQIKQT